MLEGVRGWVSRLVVSRAAPLDLPSAPALGTNKVVPNRLEVAVYEHSFAALEGGVHCWTYVSRGFARSGHKEVVISIERGNETFGESTEHVIRLLRDLYLRACEGHVFDLGAISEVPADAPGLLGEERLRGIAFLPSESLHDVQLPSACLTGLLLTKSEVDAATRFGLVRLMGLLGSRYRYYPTASWVVRGRSDVTSPQAMASSALTRTAWVRLSNSRAYLRGIEVERKSLPPTGALDNDSVKFARQEVVLEVAAREAQALSRLLVERGPEWHFALLTGPDPEADGSLVWQPGRSTMKAITIQGGSGARLAGNHVVVVPGQNHDHVGVLEDGFAVLMTNSTWREIRRRLAYAPENWGMPFSDGIGFRLKVS